MRRRKVEGVYLGIALILISTLAFTLMSALIRSLGERIPLGEIVFSRSLFGLIPLILMLQWRGELRQAFMLHKPIRHVTRAVAGIGSMFCNFGALSRIPLADATAINFVTPLFNVALAAIFLGEKVRRFRWAAVAVGFAGVLIIVRPGGGTFELAALFPMASSATWALGMIITRKMGLADPPLTTLLYTSVVGVVGAAVPALLVWRPVSLPDLALMASCGALSLVAQYFQVRAFGLGPASLLAPFSYTSIVVSTAIGALWFGTFPDGWTWVGTAIVIASGLYVLHRERVRARERTAMLAKTSRRTG